MPEAPHIRTGRTGEQAATGMLRRLGYAVIARNVRAGRHDEIDIVAFDPYERVIVFAEVKTRSRTDGDFLPELNLTHVKKRRMVRAARLWADMHHWEGGYRLDLVCIAGNHPVAHYRDLAIE